MLKGILDEPSYKSFEVKSNADPPTDTIGTRSFFFKIKPATDSPVTCAHKLSSLTDEELLKLEWAAINLAFNCYDEIEDRKQE